MRRRFVAGLAGLLTMALGVTGCASSGSASLGSSSSSGPITIGASIPLTGGLAGFGLFEKWGYQHAVDEANRAGGITVDGRKRQVKLVLLDDQTNPNTTVDNVIQLVTKDHVDALLGSCTDSLVEPGALVAERYQVPMATPCAAVNTFGPMHRWKYAYDLFFNSEDLTRAPFQTADGLGLKGKTNGTVAIIHSNGPNETVIGETEWPRWARQYGWQVVAKQSLAPDTTTFTSGIAAAKAANADMMLVVLPPPAAIALRKQIVDAGYRPKILVMEEGGEPLQFWQALQQQANGVWVGGYWDASFPYPGAQALRQEFEQETGQTYSQHIADTTTAAEVLLDALRRAGTTDKQRVAAAIGQTDKTYVAGPIKFGADHTATLPMVETQWQSGQVKVIWPANRADASSIYPQP